MSKIHENFDIREFIPKRVFDAFPVHFCMRFVDPAMLRLAIWLREALAKEYGREVGIRINDWHYGGSFQNRGYRDPESTVGKWTSAHRLAKAIDLNAEFKDTGAVIPAKDVYAFLLKHETKLLEMGVTRLEDIAFTKGWCHADSTFTGQGKLLIVKP